MFHTASGYELRHRVRTSDDVAEATGLADTRRTVAGAAVLSVFPVALVVAAISPVAAAVVATVTVAMVSAGRRVSGDRLNRFADLGTNDRSGVPAPVARPTD